MRADHLIIVFFAAGSCLLPTRQAQAWRGGGGGFHAGGFGGGYGSVHYAGASHYGPATGFTHVGGATYSGAGGTEHYSSASHTGYGGTEHYSGATYSGAGGTAHYGEASYAGYGGGARYSEHSVNYGSIQHYDASARVATPYGANVYHGPAGGTAATYHGAYVSGAAVKGPAGYGAAAVKGPAGGTAAGYRGPYSAGAVAQLPSGYTAATWHGSTYYHSGYSFYQPTWYAGSLSYVPVAPPVGYFFNALPPVASVTQVGDSTYYVSDGTYYQSSTQNGQQGYVVVPNPSAPSQQQTAAPAPQPAPAAGGAAPDPFQLLKHMSDFMGRVRHIRMTIDETFDEVAPGGQKIQLSNQRVIQVKRPDKIAVDVSGAGLQRRIVCDGSSFTAIDLVKNVYARIPMQGSLDSDMDTLAQQYGLAQPVEDLLYTDIYERLAPKIQSGMFLGQENMAGHPCNHLAFKQAGVGWQVWIDTGDKPVPWRLVISYDTTPGQPRYTLMITQFGVPFEVPDSAFEATPPVGAVSVSLLSLSGQPAAQTAP